MINRCRQIYRKNSKYYAEKGITFCEEWNEFETFLADVGYAPTPKHTLDRINPEKNYYPDNVRWATWREQALNRWKGRKARDLILEEEEIDYKKYWGQVGNLCDYS
jgi:hypothetical protein